MKPGHLLVGLLLFLSFLNRATAQNSDSCQYVIRGAVYDQATKAPMVYASIVLDSSGTGTYTDAAGQFEISGLCKKEYDLQISYLGYKTAQHHHDFHHPYIEILLASEGTLLGSVVVESERNSINLTSVTATQLDGKALQSVKTESFANAVSEIAGVNTISTGQNVAKPIIHGLHSNRILLINNGLRHEFQNWGIDHAPEIDPASIDRIEVVKGAATVRFGPEALGGVILTNPATMELATPLSGQVSLTGKSNGQSGEGSLELRKGFKWLSLMGGTAYLKQGDLHTPQYYLTNTGKEEYSIYGGFRLHLLPELDLEGYASRFDQKLGILLGSTFGNLDDLQQAIAANVPFFTADSFSYDIAAPYQKVAHDLYKAKASYVGNRQALEVQYGYQVNRRQEFGVRRGDAPNIDLELVTQSLDANWTHPAIGPLSGKLGAQWQKQANDNLPGTNTVPFVPNFDSHRLGIYLIESFQQGPNTFELGARYDKMEADITGREPDNTIYRNTIAFENLTATIGYKRQLSETQTFRSNLGTAWRPPNVAELYRFGQHAFFLEYGLWRYTINEQYDFVSTSQGILTQEDRAVPSEVGYKWINTYTLKKDHFQLEATVYLNYIQHFIYSKPGGLTRTPRGVFVYFIYDQTNALFWGTDLSSRWQHSEHFTSTIRGSYLWARQIQENDFFTAQPPANLRYQLSYQPSWKLPAQNNFQLGLNYTFEQFQHPRILSVEEFLYANQTGIDRFAEDASDFDLIPPPPAYLLVNLSWSASWKHLNWRFQVSNLLNHSYRSYTDRMRYFADQMGRNFSLTLNYNF